MKRLFFTLIALVLGATLFMGTAQAQGDIPSKLIFGIIPSREADVIVDNLEPIVAMLSERLLIPVETFIATDYVGLVEAIGTGRVDIGLMGPAAIVQAVDKYGARVILASVRRGSTSYRAQFNIRCDSGITTFEELRGKTIAFVDPGSQLVEQITQAMIDIADSPEGKKLTETLFFVTGFARVDASAYDIVREVSKTFKR